VEREDAMIAGASLRPAHGPAALHLPTALHHLRREYQAAFADPAARLHHNPPKTGIVLERYPEGPPKRLVNTMVAHLPMSGLFGSKTIYVEERPGQGLVRRGVTQVYSPDGQLLAQVDAGEFNPVRCGLIAALCTELMGCPPTSTSRLGLVGLGKVNTELARVMAELYGVSLAYVVPGSNTRMHRLVGLGYAGRVVGPESLGACDLVSCATTAYRKEEALTPEQMGVDLGRTRLWLAWDTGYILGPEFRRDYPVISDHPEQLRKHWADEFPWDSRPPEHILSVTEAAALARIAPVPVYMYGVAVADVVVAAVAAGLLT
jgi:hypothetical protein